LEMLIFSVDILVFGVGWSWSVWVCVGVGCGWVGVCVCVCVCVGVYVVLNGRVNYTQKSVGIQYLYINYNSIDLGIYRFIIKSTGS
jgi:hypothetical protein